MSKEIDYASSRHTKTLVEDEPGPGNACHEYMVIDANTTDHLVKVNFQKGPVGEVGRNGCHNEDLLSIVIHRLQGFQAGDYRCRENAIALTKIEEAMHWLEHRTKSRQSRGVEGTIAI